MTSGAWLPIEYRDFHDVPRAFVVDHLGSRFLFDCRFDDELDDDPDEYRVFRLPPTLSTAELEGPWAELPDSATFVGRLPAANVTFDRTRRAAIHAGVFDELRRFE